MAHQSRSDTSEKQPLHPPGATSSGDNQIRIILFRELKNSPRGSS